VVSKRTKFLLGIGVIAALVIGWQVAAFAVHDEGVFQLDGNATTDASPPAPFPGDDWDRVCFQVLHDAAACSTNSPTSGATAVAWDAEADRSASIFTGGGSKDPNDINQWAWKNGGGLPDKDNLLHAFAARYAAGGQQLLYFGSDRYDNSGDAVEGFWFFQDEVGTNPNGTFNGVHRDGDLLVLSDFSNGGGTSTIAVYEWDAPGGTNNTGCTAAANNDPQPGQCGAANLRLLASSTAANCANPNLNNPPTPAPGGTNDQFCGIVNADTITMPWDFTDKSNTPNDGALNGEFFEGGVNLTALGLGDRCFSSFASETRSSTSPTATLKDFITGGFGSCTSGVTTEQQGPASKSIGTGSISVTDKATINVSGVTNWNGTVQFSLKGPTNTPGVPETTENIGNPVAVSNSTIPSGTVESPAATVTAVGHYCWSAQFMSQTTGVPNGVDNGVNECFDVTPVTPTLATLAGDDVTLGQAITDTATLTGTATKPGTTNGSPDAINPSTPGNPAGGTITFTLYGPNDCTTVATGTGQNPQTVNVNGDSAANSPYGPVNFTPNATGTYHWVATYSGDSPNTNGTDHNLDCSDVNEDVVVTSVPSSMTTAQSFIPNDSATVSATQGGSLAGTVTFDAYESSDCSGTAIFTQTRPVSGASPQTVSTTNTTVSTTAANISWRVSYDSTNQAQDDISAKCVEKTALSIDNDGTVTSP
jgi:hypothetical protein